MKKIDRETCKVYTLFYGKTVERYGKRVRNKKKKGLIRVVYFLRNFQYYIYRLYVRRRPWQTQGTL